jgi:hypothetical protein
VAFDLSPVYYYAQVTCLAATRCSARAVLSLVFFLITITTLFNQAGIPASSALLPPPSPGTIKLQYISENELAVQ